MLAAGADAVGVEDAAGGAAGALCRTSSCRPASRSRRSCRSSAGAGAAGAWPGKTEAGSVIGVRRRLDLPDFDFLEDLSPAASSFLASAASNAFGSRPAATASWRARYGLRPAAISRLTSATVGTACRSAFAARAVAADADVAAGWSKFAPQFGVRSIA